MFEAEVLLAFVLEKDRTYLHTWSDKSIDHIDPKLLNQFKLLISRRLRGEPIAYLIGEKEFWSLPFKVTPDVLIPRPETELLIETILKMRLNPELHFQTIQRVLDLGTGSGCIAISLGKECPDWEITAVDNSDKALELARNNAQRLHIKNIRFLKSDWYSAFGSKATIKPTVFDIIVANPPYLAKTDAHLYRGDCRFEPQSALTDFDDGLSAYREIIFGAVQFLKPGGWLLLEHGYQQGKAIRTLLEAHHFQAISSLVDYAKLDRVTISQK